MNPALRAAAAPLVAVALACAAASGPAGAPGRSPVALPVPERGGRAGLVALVSVAGLTPDRYRRGPDVAMPTLAALAEAGASADAVRSVAPAASYPAHATFVTGVLPAAHGIAADRLLGERGVRAARQSHVSQLRAPTLWQLAGQAGERVAALDWPSSVGAPIPLLLPDVEPTRRGETWLSLLRDAGTPELVAQAERAGAGAPAADAPGPARDAVLVQVACAVLAQQPAPSLLLLRLSQTEPALAARGPRAPEAESAFARADAELARLLECLGGAGPAALVVVGDRGLAPLHTRIAPNAVLVREGLLAPEPGGGVRWSAIARSNGGSTFVYARTEADAVRARRVLEAEARATRAFRVVSASEMLRLGADPAAWFGLEAEPGFGFSDASEPPLLRPAASRGVGGYLPERTEMDAGFVAWGSGIRDGVRIPFMRQSDVAPTLARLLGLELGEVDGRALVGVLQPAAAISTGPAAAGGR